MIYTDHDVEVTEASQPAQHFADAQPTERGTHGAADFSGPEFQMSASGFYVDMLGSE